MVEVAGVESHHHETIYVIDFIGLLDSISLRTIPILYQLYGLFLYQSDAIKLKAGSTDIKPFSSLGFCSFDAEQVAHKL